MIIQSSCLNKFELTEEISLLWLQPLASNPDDIQNGPRIPIGVSRYEHTLIGNARYSLWKRIACLNWPLLLSSIDGPPREMMLSPSSSTTTAVSSARLTELKSNQSSDLDSRWSILNTQQKLQFSKVCLQYEMHQREHPLDRPRTTDL